MPGPVRHLSCLRSLVRRGILVFVLVFGSLGGAAAQVQVSREVTAAGGGPMGSASFGVTGTAGQPAAGGASGSSFAAALGFWAAPGPVVTTVDPGPTLPASVALEQNRPNPFNPRTTIPFALPRESHVTLRVFDAAGRLVRELVDEVRPAGTYRESFAAHALASGIYFCRLEADGRVRTRTLVLLK